MKVTPLLSLLLIVAGGLTTMQAQPYYLQGSAAPCSWGNTSASCELTDPDNDGVFELTYDFGGAPIDVNEFKVYDSGNNNYIPGGANVWFNHQGGTVTFRYNSNNGDVDAIESAPFSICAPGEFSGWNNAEPMLDAGGNQWCYTIPTAGTYQWKPTSCGSWASWEPTDGSRNTNTSNWIIETTSDNEQFCVTYDPATGRVVPNNAPTGYYLRGTLGPCGWNDLSGSCRLTDPDNDNIYELVIDFGGVPQGRQEAKVYHVDSDTWYPLTFSNGWYYHQGGTVTVRFDANTGEVQIIEEGFTPSICAPGEFSGWNNGYSMNDYGNGVFCIPVASAGTYQWKPTVCGSWDSWQPNTGERNTNADNWVTTIEYPGQLLCVTYDAASGKVLPGSLDSAVAVPTMSQWGLILLCLIVLTLGMVTVRQRQLAMAGSESAGFSLRNLPFDRARFTRALRWAGLAIVAVFAVAVLVFGYVMTTADVPGSLLALPLVAYLMTLLSE